MPKRYRYTATCQQCSKVLRANGKTGLSTALARHRREYHGDGEALARRQGQQAARVAASRRIPPTASRTSVALSGKSKRSKGAAWITCPRRRDDLFKMARAECLKIGFKVKDIHRRVGIDWQGYKVNQRACVCGVSNKW